MKMESTVAPVLIVKNVMRSAIENREKELLQLNNSNCPLKKQESCPEIKSITIPDTPITSSQLFTFFIYKIFSTILVTAFTWAAPIILNSIYTESNCVICGLREVYNYNFEIPLCTRLTFWVYAQSFWSTYIPGFYNIFYFIYIANGKKNKFRLIISFCVLCCVHYFTPLIVYAENGRLFPINVIPIGLALIFSFGVVINTNNYKNILKFMIGITLYYSTFIIIFFIPLIIPFMKENFLSFYPITISLVFTIIKQILNFSFRFLFDSNLISYEYGYHALVGITCCIDIFNFVYFLKQKFEWAFYLTICINFILNTGEDSGFWYYLKNKFVKSENNCNKLFSKIFCLKNESTPYEDIIKFTVPERFCIDIIILIFYYVMNVVGVVAHPENSGMTSCKLDWKYRSLVSDESLRLTIYFVINLIFRYLVILFVKCKMGVKNYKFFSQVSLMNLIDYGCVNYIFIHIVFQFAFNFM